MKRKPLSKKTRFEVFKRDGFSCKYCGKKPPETELQIDHVVPLSAGGTDNIENLVTSCVECNMGKGSSGGDNLTDDEFNSMHYILQQIRFWNNAGFEQIQKIIYRGCTTDPEESWFENGELERLRWCITDFGLMETARVAAIVVAEYVERDDEGHADLDSIHNAVGNMYRILGNRSRER